MKATHRPTPLERFTARVVELPSEFGPPCWIFTGHVTPAGYGQGKIAGKKVLIHRFMWEAHRGPIGPGLEVDHLCRRRDCCNPDHLEPVTHKVNQRRGFSPMGINARKTHCHRGHELTDENVYVSTSQGGHYRNCKTCRRIHQANYRAKRSRA